MATDEARIRALQKTALFGATNDETCAFVLARAPRITAVAGAWIFRQGDRGSSLFWLESGRVAILKDCGGEPMELRRLGPGDCFGEVALFDFGPRSASVRAVEDSRALEISNALLLREVAQRDLEQFTLITMNLGRELARRLRATEERLLRRGEPWPDDPVPTS